VSADEAALFRECQVCRVAVGSAGITAMCRHEHRVHFHVCEPCGRRMTVEQFNKTVEHGKCLPCWNASNGAGHFCHVRHSSEMTGRDRPVLYVGEPESATP